MCTVTWCRQASGYELFFNRDELRRRVAGRPPRADDHRRYLAPEDPKAGGTWLAVNTAGTTIGILNAHPPAEASQPAQPMQGTTSRGRLVRALADLEQAPELNARLNAMDLALFRPFTIFAVSPALAAAVLRWDGRQLTTQPTGQPPLLSSSSIDSDGADGARRRGLAAKLDRSSDPVAAHLAFHRSHYPHRGPLSPCMHRSDARTVSFCHVRVREHSVAIDYVAGPPCRHAAGQSAELLR